MLTLVIGVSSKAQTDETARVVPLALALVLATASVVAKSLCARRFLFLGLLLSPASRSCPEGINVRLRGTSSTGSSRGDRGFAMMETGDEDSPT